MTSRALRTELARLATDRPLLVSAVLALGLALSLVLSLPEEVRRAPESARLLLFDALVPSLLANAAVLAGLYGSFRLTSDLERGVLARQLGFVGRVPLLAARGVAATVGGAALALVATGAGTLVFAAATGVAPGDPLLPVAATLIGAAAGGWGLALGTVIGRHLLALFLVPLTLVAAVPLATWQPEARLALPLGAWLAALQAIGWGVPREPADTSAVLPALTAGLAWSVLAAVAAVAVFRRRDVA